MSEKPVIDQDRQKILQGLGEGMIKKLLEAFLPDADATVDKIEQLKDHPEEIRRELHTIKGAAINIGLTALYVELDDFHKKIKENSDFSFDDSLASVRKEMGRVHDLYKNM